jgi:hypothetical protein
MTPEQFDACFDLFERTAYKLETRRRTVAPGEADRIRAFEQGLPRPVRSVRTEPWLARIAVTTATQGKLWQRVRVLDDPLTPYQAYGIPGLVESQAAGEDVHIAKRSRVPDLARDFWWFDEGLPGEFALLLYYGPDDRYTGAEVSTDPVVLEMCATEWRRALAAAVTLNEYLADSGLATRVA